MLYLPKYVFSLWCPAQVTVNCGGGSRPARPSSSLLSCPASFSVPAEASRHKQPRRASDSRNFCLQVEIVGQLSGQMAEMVGGVVETVGEEPEPESEDFPEQHEEEEEEVTKVSLLSAVGYELLTKCPKTRRISSIM